MGIYKFKGISPIIGKETFLAESADVIGDVIIGEQCSLWFNVTVRGDTDIIRIGNRTNIQDNTVVHGSKGIPTVLGDDITVGHSAIIHSCTIGNNVLIGMGATILDEALIPDNCIVGANSLVTKGKKFNKGKLIMGSPAKEIRDLTKEEIEAIKKNSIDYIEEANEYK